VFAFSGACLLPASNTLLRLPTRGTHKASLGAHKSGCSCTHSGNGNREEVMKRPPKTTMSASAKKPAETGDLHSETGAEAGELGFCAQIRTQSGPFREFKATSDPSGFGHHT